MSFPDAIQALQQSSSSASESTGWTFYLRTEARSFHCIEGIQKFVQQITAAVFLPKRTLLRQGVCVCVSHLHRCKTSFFLFYVKAGGQEPITVCPGQRRPDSMGVKTYLQFSSWWDVATPRTTMPIPNNFFYMVLHGWRYMIFDDDLFAGFGVWFGLRWIFSEDHHCIHEVLPRDLV